MTVSELIAARKAERVTQVPEPVSGLSDKILKRKKEREAPAPPLPEIDYSTKNEIGELPTADLPLENTLKASGGLLLDSRPEAQINILKEYVPGVESDFDDEGHAFVTYKGKQYYLNKPGFSGADVNQFLADAVTFIPAGKIASIGKSALARMGIGALTYGSTSVGQDLAANALGSEQDIDPVKAGVVAVLGGAAEAVTPFVIRGVRKLFKSKKLFDGDLTKRGKEMIRELGFDPETFDTVAAKEFSDLLDGKVDPKTAAGLAQNKRFGIRTTKGEATQDFNLLQKEDLARTGGFGERRQQQMQVFDDARTQDLLKATDKVQSDVAGAPASISREAEGAGIIAEGLKSRAARQKAVIDQAYTQASQFEARLSTESLKEFTEAVPRLLKETDTLVDKTLTPSTVKAMKEVKKLTKNKNITALTLKNLEGTRRKLGQMAEAATNPADKRGVSIIKSELDNWLDTAFDRALFEGDEQALKALKGARETRKRYGDLFEKRGKGDVAGKIIEDIVKFDADERQTLSYLFGRGKLGGKDSANKTALKIKDVLGGSSPEWQAFKETAFLRLLKNTAKDHNGKKTFNGQSFVRNFNEAMNDAPKLMRTIFGDTLPTVKAFKDAVDRATFRPEGAINRSRSGVAVSKIVQDSFKRLALVMGLTGDLSSYVLINGASKVAGSAGKDFSKGVRPALPSSSFSAALAAAGASGVGVVESRFLSPRQSANNRNEGETERNKSQTQSELRQ